MANFNSRELEKYKNFLNIPEEQNKSSLLNDEDELLSYIASQTENNREISSEEPIPSEELSKKQNKPLVSNLLKPKSKLESEFKKESEELPPKQPLDYLQLLEQAKQTRDRQQLIANLGSAGEQLSSAITGMVRGGVVTKPIGGDFWKDLAKQAEQPIEDISTQYKLEAQQEERDRLLRRRDPGSEESKFARDLLKQQGITVPENATAEALEKYTPQLTNILNQREAREARKQEAQLRMADIASRKDLTKDQKQETFIQSLRKETTSGALGKMFSNFNTSKKIQKALSEFEKDPSGYTDYATLMGGLKALQGDESVVRESEIRLGMNAASLGNKIENWTDRLISGKSLQPEQRKQIINAVRILSNTAQNQYKEAIQPIINQAESLDIDTKKLVGEGVLDNTFIEKSPPEKKIIKKGYNKQTNQTQLIYDDGTSEIVEGKK